MERFKNLNLYKKAVLIFMSAMVLVFSVIYPVTISRVGFEYENAILAPSQENSSTVYSGRLQRQQARFTVSEDKTVVFQYGSKTYGPYTAKEDPAAIPVGEGAAEVMTGVELRRGDDILFRGGVLKTADSYWLYDEDGTLNTAGSFQTGGVAGSKGGNDIDPIALSASTILALMNDPELTHKGDWVAWFGAMLICAFNAALILFADELFRWNLSFRIRSTEHAEPSDWEIAGRYMGWTVLLIVALLLFIIGLQ